MFTWDEVIDVALGIEQQVALIEERNQGNIAKP